MKVSKRFIVVNLITLLRVIGSILLIPIYLNCGYFTLALCVLVFVSTDFIDGTLARMLHASTFFGAIFDAMSDKLFNVIVLLLLAIKLPIVLFVILIELLILYVGFNSTISGNKTRATYVGKAKMVIVSICIVLMMLLLDYDKFYSVFNISLNAMEVINYLIIITFVSETITLLDYIRLYIKNGKKKKVFEYELKPKAELHEMLLSHEFYKKNKNKPIEELVLKKVFK